MLVKVAKEVRSVVDKDTGKKRNISIFPLGCGKAKVAVKIVRFPNDDGIDLAYAGRVALLSAFEDMDVELYKKEGSYVDGAGDVKRFTNYEVLCGDEYVPVEVFFNDKGDGKDPYYGTNRRILSAFAALRESRKMEKDNTSTESEPAPVDGKELATYTPTLEPMDDDISIPFAE